MNFTSIIIIYSILLVVFLALTFLTLYSGLKMKNVVGKTSLILLSILLVVVIIFGTIGFVYYKNKNDDNGNNINTIPNQSIGSSTVIQYLPPQNRYVNYWNIYDDNGWWWDKKSHKTNVNIHNYNSNSNKTKPILTTTTTTTKPVPTSTTKLLPAPTIAITTTTKPALIIEQSPSPLVNVAPSLIPQYTGITAEQLMTNALSSLPVSPTIAKTELPFTPSIPEPAIAPQTPLPSTI